jgi:hypothetical protein
MVAGAGHGHNELVSWVLNHNSTINSNFDWAWELYPGTYGNFLRISDGWNLKEYPDYNIKYHQELRHTKDSVTTEDQITELKNQTSYLWDDNTNLSQFVNCMNWADVAGYANKHDIPVVTGAVNLKKSKHISHYVMMEFSEEAAADRDYNDMSLKQIAKWLFVKENRQEALYDLNYNYVTDINKILSDDQDEVYQELTNLYTAVGLSPKWNQDLFEKLQWFKYINTPVHPLMCQIQEMTWDDIMSIKHGL